MAMRTAGGNAAFHNFHNDYVRVPLSSLTPIVIIPRTANTNGTD